MMEWILSSSVLILVVLLIRQLTRGKISMRLRYALWAIVLVRLLIPFSFGSTPVSIMNTAQQVPVVQEAEALRDMQYIERSSDGTVEGYLKSDYMADFPTVVAENKSEADFARMNTLLDIRELLSPLWKIGALVLLAVFLLVNVRFRHTLHKSRTRLELADYPLPVYVTDAVETPCLFGLFRPAVYVTPEVRDNPQALRYALAHERTHFYHGDFFWSALRCLCLAIHWYNPLVWLAVSLSRQDAELACDEGTIRRIGEEQRIAYGNTLIDLTCTQRRPADLLYAATTMTGSKKSIRERVTFIARRPKNLALAVLSVVLVIAMAVGCTFTGADKPTEEPKAAPEPLTQDELAYFQENYFSSSYSIANQFLTSLYTSPENIDLFQLFYNGTTLPGAIGEEELQVLLDAYPMAWADCPCTKLPVKDMDTILEQYTGLRFEETAGIGLDSLTYLEQYDAYYHFHGDTNARTGVEFSAGYRQGNQVSLYYDSDKVVTLEEAGDSWHILSNRYAPTPTAVAQVPDEAPFLTVPVASLDTVEPQEVKTTPFARQDWGQLVTSFFYEGTGDEPNRDILVGVWPDGSIYACYVVYDNAAGEDTYHRFAKLCDAAYTDDILNSEEPSIFIRPYTDLLGHSGFSLFCSYGTTDTQYYTFDAQGRLIKVFETASAIDRQFTADGRPFAFCYAGGLNNPKLLLRDGDVLRTAPLAEFLRQALPEPFDPMLIQWNDQGVGLISYFDESISYLPRCVVRVTCDGENILFYQGDGKSYTDHIADDIDVPKAVLEEAKRIAESDLDYLIERYPDMASLDDWRISDIPLLDTKVLNGVTVELYVVQSELHTPHPEHFTYAGATTSTTDGWVAVDCGYFDGRLPTLFLNTATGRCISYPVLCETELTFDALLAENPTLIDELRSLTSTEPESSQPLQVLPPSDGAQPEVSEFSVEQLTNPSVEESALTRLSTEIYADHSVYIYDLALKEGDYSLPEFPAADDKGRSIRVTGTWGPGYQTLQILLKNNATGETQESQLTNGEELTFSVENLSDWSCSVGVQGNAVSGQLYVQVS